MQPEKAPPVEPVSEVVDDSTIAQLNDQPADQSDIDCDCSEED